MSSAPSISPDEIVDALEVIAQNGIPASGSAWITDVGTNDFLEFFEHEILDDLLANGGSTCRFFEAAYGGGKTHLLDLLNSLAVRKGMVSVRIDLSQSLRLDDWRIVTAQVLKDMVIQVEGQEHRSLPRVLEVLGESGRARLAQLVPGRLPHPGFANAMLRVLERNYPSDEARQLLHRYLLGERIGAGVLRQAGIRRVNEPLSQRNSEQILTTVANALNELGVPGLVLVFDENERTLEVRGSRPSRKTRTAANLIRRLVDAYTMGEIRGAVAIFAVLPGFMDRCAEAYAALGQRVQPTPISAELAPWRWPTLGLGAISRTVEYEEFARAAIEKLVKLVSQCDGETAGLADAMHAEAGVVLSQHAGDAYRRPLMKELATLALGRISP